jgi:hypothetical protein
MRNVARTWAYETGELVGEKMSKQLPFNDYYEVSVELLIVFHRLLILVVLCA